MMVLSILGAVGAFSYIDSTRPITYSLIFMLSITNWIKVSCNKYNGKFDKTLVDSFCLLVFLTCLSIALFMSHADFNKPSILSLLCIPVLAEAIREPAKLLRRTVTVVTGLALLGHSINYPVLTGEYAGFSISMGVGACLCLFLLSISIEDPVDFEC